jgi:hypothetical protein
MLFEIDKTGVHYHVILADVVDPNGKTIRSFATSDELVTWLKTAPSTTYNVIVNTRGNKISGVTANVDPYSIPPTPGALDVQCNHGIAHDSNGSVTQSGGASGWG